MRDPARSFPLVRPDFRYERGISHDWTAPAANRNAGIGTKSLNNNAAKVLPLMQTLAGRLYRPLRSGRGSYHEMVIGFGTVCRGRER